MGWAPHNRLGDPVRAVFPTRFGSGRVVIEATTKTVWTSGVLCVILTIAEREQPPKGGPA